jgi:hypothetical protein
VFDKNGVFKETSGLKNDELNEKRSYSTESN